MNDLSRRQNRCVIEATIDDLVCFRRGFARTKQGPFFGLQTINALIDRGVLRAYHPLRGRRGLRISARAA